MCCRKVLSAEGKRVRQTYLLGKIPSQPEAFDGIWDTDEPTQLSAATLETEGYYFKRD